MTFLFFSAQRFSLRKQRKCCFDLINHSMRNSIIHEFCTQRMFFDIQYFVDAESQKIEISCNIFSQWLYFKLHAFECKFICQFHHSKHFAFVKNKFYVNSFVMMFTQSQQYFFTNNAYLFCLINIMQTHFCFCLQSIQMYIQKWNKNFHF